MDRRKAFESIASRLRQAASESNWRELRAVDRQLAVEILPRLSAGPALTAREQVAYSELRRAHVEVRKHCKRESDLYATRLASMHEMKIGWAAYAQCSDADRGAE